MTVTGTDGLQITSASYDLSTQTLTVNVNLNTSAPGYVAPTEFHAYTDDGTFTNPQEQPLTGFTQNGSSASLTLGKVTPTQLNNWLNSVDGTGLYVDVSSPAPGQSMTSSPTFYQGVQLTAGYWTNGSAPTPTTPTITGDFTDAAGTIPATNTISGVNYVNGANDIANQTLTGTADAGDGVTVNMTDGNNNTSSITTTADANGKWSIPVGDLPDGTYNFTATATNGPGSSSSDPFSFTVKAATIEGDISDSAVSNGFINSVNFNNGVTTLSGQAEAGDTVTVTDGSNVYKATVASNGSWTAQISGLADGQSYSYTATATDAVGNTATSDPFGFTVKTETSEGGISDSAVSNGFINGVNFNNGVTTLSGQAEAGDTVTVTDGSNVYKATVASNGSWTAQISGLADGQSYSYTATATDAAGNTATSDPFGFTVKTETSEGGISDSAVSNGFINGVNFNGGVTTLSGQAEAGDTVTVTDGSNVYKATVASNGSWTAQISGLADGQSYSYTATATDAAGNTATSDPFGFTVKTETNESDISDSAVVNNYLNAANFNNGTTTLTGTAEAGDSVSVAVTINNNTTTQAATVNQNGAWSLQLTGLMNGDVVSAVATATDAAGNTATSDPFGFTVDTTPPTVTSVTENIAVNPSAASVTVNTVAADPVGVSSVTVNGAGSASLTSGSDTSGTWSYTDTPFQNGKHTYSVTAADAAGNTATAPGSTVYYNNSAQTLAVVGTAGGDTVSTSQEGVTATITDRAGGGNSVNATGGSSWVEINDKTGGDMIGVSGDANTVVLTGASAGSSVNVSGLAGHDVARVNGGATVTIDDSALKGGYNTVTAYGGGNSVAVTDTGGNDTISVGGNGNTVTLHGTGGGDRINFGAGGGDTLALDAMPAKGDYDSISNFIAKSNSNYSHDTIDVSSLGITAVDNNFTVNKGVVDLAADSVAWLTAGNQSAVYINAGSSNGAATDALLVNGSLNPGDFTLKPKI